MPVPGDIIEFGRFQVRRRERALLADGVTLELGSRAFDLLLALIDADGALVSKDELLRRVWPDAVVEENNLQVQASALRRAFGADRELIRTVPRHGYCFTGRFAVSGPRPVPTPAPDAAAPWSAGSNLPVPVGELIGRETDLLQVIELQTKYRLLTLTGPGGIGKTSLALTAAWRVIDQYPDGVRVADLASLTDPTLVLPAVAAVLDLRRLSLPLLAEHVAAALESRRLLLVLDNCEHLIEPVARIAEALLHGAPRLHILATSQEPLRADGERVYRVPPLTVPGDDTEHAADQLRHGAVRLFVARARLADARLEIDDELAATITSICRRLDGIPLAIELAAARAALLGTQPVASGLDDRFRLLAGGRRTALERHQTLRATLAWSFDLLSERLRKVLCQLTVFGGSFTLEAAEEIARGLDGSPDIADCIAGLVARSLVGLESAGLSTRYRLLETVRVYALEQLPATDADELRRRHLRFYTERLQRGTADWQTMPTADWLTAYRGDLENVRAALQWSFTSKGAGSRDTSLGAALAAASMPLWLESSLHTESRQWAERALAVPGTHDTPEELVLQVARGSVLLSAGGDSGQAEAALRRGLALAEVQDNREYALRALYSLWIHFLHENDYGAAYSYAERFRAIAELREDADDVLIGDRLIGATEHYLGRQNAARSRLAGWLIASPIAAQQSRESRFGLDQHVAALTAMARVLALQGELDQAMEAAQRAVDAARKLDRVASFCHALGEQCVVALWTGNTEGLADTAAKLIGTATRYGLRFWRPHALVAQGVLAANQGASEDAAASFNAALDEVGSHRVDVLYPSLIGSMIEGLAAIGRHVRGRALLDQALGRDWVMQRFYTPELLMVRGRLALAHGDPAAAAGAEGDFGQALIHASRQPALLLELRAAMGLAQLATGRGRSARGLSLLEGVYSRFAEGLDTVHLRAAREILAALRESQQERTGNVIGRGSGG